MIVFQELLGTVKISFLNLPSKILSRFRFVFTGEKSIEIVISIEQTILILILDRSKLFFPEVQ
jgi:hypothetical protein